MIAHTNKRGDNSWRMLPSKHRRIALFNPFVRSSPRPSYHNANEARTHFKDNSIRCFRGGIEMPASLAAMECDVAGIRQRPCSRSRGFSLSPSINGAHRVQIIEYPPCPTFHKTAKKQNHITFWILALGSESENGQCISHQVYS